MRSKRFLTLLLAVCMVISMLAPTASAVTTGEHDHTTNNSADASDKANSLLVNGGSEKIPTLRGEDAPEANKQENGTPDENRYAGWEANQADGSVSADLLNPEVPASITELRELANTYAETDVVSAFIVMEDKPLIQTYGNILDVPADKEELLLQQQEAVVMMIEEDVLDGEELEVTNQFTYLANTIIVETEFGNLEQIAQLPGVKSVFVSPMYYACAVDSTVKVAKPFTVSAGEMSGVPNVWQDLGLTGSGMTIAIIDTGLDMDHPSFAAAPADPSMTVEDIEAVMDKLNAVKLNPGLTAEDLYNTEKVPFAFNYFDTTTDVNHYPITGDHGTHVAGIAGANALDGTGVVGMAPDAQIIAMQVFTDEGGAPLAEIVAALEDAMILGCDVANLSLGSSAGFTKSSYDFVNEVYENLENSDIIVNISAGNDGTSSYDNMWGTNLNTTGNPDNASVGSPSTYINVNSIASVDNAMMNSTAINVGGEDYAYNDAIGLYVTFNSLAGQDLEYVMVPGLGEAADFEGLDVEGKVAVIARGTINFSLKLYNAESAGAIGVIITNNEPGSISGFGMSMTDDDGNLNDGVSGEVPCILVSLAAGEALAAQETKTLTVYADLVAVPDEGGGQMSSFSSWGVAPDLSLLPDMAGVGGNVYSSVDNGQYDYMSGTSMSAPQVSGMSALVVEYLKEKVGITDEQTLRQMANGLMMSTAEVVIDADSQLEASPRQQGAGLVNALNALTSEAYLTIENAENNNKPKAELGDGNGTYSFTFTVHNFGTADKTYTLGSSLLTEAVNEDYYAYYGEYFMAGYEAVLDGTVTFSTGDSVTVPAGSSVDVTATVSVSAEGKAWLDKYYPNGGYVEGYVYLENADENGVDMNLPFLGFYGDWAEAPIFDTAYWYDNSFWSVAPANGLPEGNEFWHVMWTDLAGSEWVLGMNPYSGAYLDENGNVKYDPANNVISNNGDGALDGLTDIYLSLMRNADHLVFTYTDAKTGEILYELDCEQANKTMFLSNYGQVVPFLHTWWGLAPWDFTTEAGETLPSGTEILLTVTGSLEYGEEYDVHGQLQFPITLDTNAPALVGEIVQSQDQDGHNLVTFTVEDESSLAAVFLMNPAATQTLAVGYDPVRNADGSWTVTMDVTGLGDELLLVLCDYGANEGYYELKYDQYANAPEADEDALYAYRVADAAIFDDSLFGWVTIDKETAEVTQLTNDEYEYYALTAAEYVDGYIFAVDAGYNLVVMQPGLFFRKEIRNLGVGVVDMAFDKTTGTMYVATKGENEWGGEVCTLSTLDLLTGELTELRTYDNQYDMPWAMTFVDGELYAVKYYNAGFYKLYTGEPYSYEVDSGYGYTYEKYVNTYDLLPVKDAEGNDMKLTTSSGGYASPYYTQSMTYSETDGKIYYAYYTYTANAELFTFDVSGEVPTYTSVAFPVDAECVGVLTLDDEGYTLPEAEAIEQLLLSEESLILLEGETAQLEATILPWNYEPAEDVVWSSGDESVATVDQNGLVAAVSEGTVEITAVCEGVTVTCYVTVVHVEGSFYAYNYFNGNGDYGDWIHVDMDGMTIESLYGTPADFIAADYNGHDGNIYGYDMTGQFYCFNPETGDCAALGNPSGAVPMDMAYDYSTGFMYAITTDQNAGTTTVHYVNMNSGALVEVGNTYDVYVTLACGTDGSLYGITSAGVLSMLVPYEIEDWYTGEIVKGLEPMYIMEGLGELYYAQSMCYDHNNNVLLWTNPETSVVYWIDIFSGEPYVLDLGDPSGSGLIEYIGMYTVPAEIPELAYVPVTDVAAEDMLVLVGGTNNVVVTIDPLNATNQDITYVSADESIATVDENGVVAGVAEGTTTVTGTLVDGENTYEFTFNVNVKNSAGDINGFIATDLASGGGLSWAVFPDYDPTTMIDYPGYTDYMIYSEEYVDGKIYAYGFDMMDWAANFQFMVIDPETYEIESMTDMGDGFPFVYDMTFDYTTGTMYAVAGYNDSSSDLYMVDMTTGRLVLVMQTEPFIMSLAADAEGNLYGTSASTEEYDPWSWNSSFSNAMLYKFDVAAGTYEFVMDTGIKANKLSTMAFDFDTGNLYWSAMFQAGFYDPYESGLYLVDIEEGASYNLGLIGAAGSQLTGMYIIADEYPEVPDELYNATLSSSMEILSPGESVELTYFLQPAGVEVTTEWASDNEAVATVDENGVVTAVAPGVATITLTVTDGTTTITVTCTIVVYGMDDYFLSYNMSNDSWYKIDRLDPVVVYNAEDGAEELPDVRSAVIIDSDKIYGYDVENGFFVTSEKEGFVRTYLGTGEIDLPDDVPYENGYGEDYFFEVRDLAYDATTGKMYALTCMSCEFSEEWDGEISSYTVELLDGCEIYEVDMTNGTLTYVSTFCTPYFDSVSNVYGMTVTEDGTFYVYSSYDDYVSSVDVETGMINQITTLQNQGVYGGSDGEPMAMEYDAVTNSIFLLFTSNGSYYQLFKFDLSDKSLTPMGNVGEVLYNADTWRYDGDQYASLVINSKHNSCTWSEWVLTTEPTCTAEGEETRACVGCGATETRPVDMIDHEYVATVVAPTCTEDGYTIHVCSACGDNYTDTVIPAEGHNFGEWTVVEEATDTENGYMQCICAECGEKATVALYAVLEGNGSEWTQESDKDLTIVVNSGDDELAGIIVDGEAVDESAYTVSEDGMTITFTAEFLATLGEGEHEVIAVYEEGLAEATFTVAEAKKDSGSNSDTGDAFSTMWIALMVLSMAGAAALVLNRKKFFVK